MSTTSIAISVVVVVIIGVVVLLNRAGQSAAPDIKVLSQLRQAGSDLSKPHPVEFFLYFSTEEAAHRVVQQLIKEGFTAIVSNSATEEQAWLVQATKTMIPQAEELVRLREWFSAVTAAEKGRYDGWGTPVVK